MRRFKKEKRSKKYIDLLSVVSILIIIGILICQMYFWKFLDIGSNGNTYIYNIR